MFGKNIVISRIANREYLIFQKNNILNMRAINNNQNRRFVIENMILSIFTFRFFVIIGTIGSGYYVHKVKLTNFLIM